MQATLILTALVNDGPAHLLDISSRTNIPRGSLYNILSGMEHKGLIKSELAKSKPSPSGKLPRIYSATELGAAKAIPTDRKQAT